jgi:hypothetical protein
MRGYFQSLELSGALVLLIKLYFIGHGYACYKTIEAVNWTAHMD